MSGQSMKSSAFSRRTLYVVLVAAVIGVVIACATFRARRYSCVSNEPGLRGEVMRGQDGKDLYFNGECWTRQPVAPTDSPF
jgi:hypothetical protein